MSSARTDLVEEWQELAARHARVNEALERDLQRSHGLSVSEFEALACLAKNSPDGCRLQELEGNVHVSQSAMSRLISRLADEGLVERRTCEQDRRGIFAYLTADGRDRLAAAEGTQADVLERTLRDA